LTYISIHFYLAAVHAFDVLGDPVRRRILELLADGELTSGAITDAVRTEFGISQPAVSQHLRVLRDNGFATVRPDGARRLYAVDATPLHEVEDWLDHVRAFWDQRFDSFATDRPGQARTPPPCRHHRQPEGAIPMIDITSEIAAVQRDTGRGETPAGEGRTILVRRTFATPIDDAWDALTDPDRIGRWFLPISGEFRVGGQFQFDGNAGGEILACQRPERLRVTWALGESDGPPSSIVELRLTPAGDDATTIELEHTAIVPDDAWEQFGPGAVGVGWDLGIVGFAQHLRGESIADPIAWQLSDEGRAFAKASSVAWGDVNLAAGADPGTAARGVANTNSFYAPDPDPS